MSDRPGLIRSMIDDPHDDTPRLVMADWFEDHGESERSEFIRVQCEIARLDPFAERERLETLAAREKALWEAHGPAWCQEFSTWARSKIRFRRGFASSLSATFAQWVKSGKLANQTPLNTLALTNHDPARAEQIAASESLRSIRLLRPDLSYPWHVSVPILKALGQSPHLTNLRLLDLYRGGCVLGDTTGDALARALAESESFSNVESLSMGYCAVGPQGMAALMQSPHLTRLKILDLSNCPIGDDGTRRLAQSPPAAKLAALDLVDSGLTHVGMSALANSPHLAGLTHLNVRGHGSGTAAARALARSSYLTRLRSLTLSFGTMDIGSGIGPAGARALAESPNLSNLVYLNLFGNRIGDEGVEALADSPYLTQLRALDLGQNDLSEAGVRALMTTQTFPHLERLGFYATPAAFLYEAALKAHLPSLRLVSVYSLWMDTAARRQVEEAFAPLHGEALLRRIV